MESRILLWMVGCFLLLTPPIAEAKISKTQKIHKIYQPRAPRLNTPPTQTVHQEQMLNDLGFIRNVFQVSYAPMDWKKQHLNWNLDREISIAKKKVLQKRDMTTKEFQWIINDLLNSVKDYHVQSIFYSTEKATLPFSIQGAGGKYFISYIAPSEIDSEPLSFSLGDEVVSFNGEPMHSVVEVFKRSFVGSSDTSTDQALAEKFFTKRKGFDVPQGTAVLVLRQAMTGQLITQEVEWDYQPERIANAFLLRSIQATALPPPARVKNTQSKSEKKSLFKDEFLSPFYERLGNDFNENEPSVLLGAKRNMLPPLGEILWEAPEQMSLHAYLFALPGGKTGGFIRIPHYNLDGEQASQEFTEIIHRFQEDADVLVVDQTNNPGGRVTLLYSFLAMLTDKPLEVLRHRFKITQEDVYMAFTEMSGLNVIEDDEMAQEILGEMFQGYYVDYECAQNLLTYCHYLIDQWNEGKMFTDYHFLYGIDTIKPHPIVHYTKPILVLVNSLDFSCGDFFPAILQDNRRAKIMGSRTAGAGGTVEQVSFPNLSGIDSISLTTSIAQRPNGQLIENLGVTPDIPYEVTALDLQNHYVEYVSRILEELTVLTNE